MSNDTVYNPFSDEDEILFKDKDGKLKVLKGGKVLETAEHEKETLPAKGEGETPKPMPEVPAEIPATKPEGIDYEKEAIEIIQGVPLNIQEESLKNRLKNIIISRFKDIRDSIETSEILLRSSRIGGMGFTEDGARPVLRAIEEKCKKAQNEFERIKDITPFLLKENPVSAPMISSPEAPGIEEEKAEPGVPETQNQTTSEKKDILKLIKEMPDYNIFPPKPEDKAKAAPEAPPRITTESKPEKEEIKITTAPKIEPAIAPRKDRVKLIGPVDELRELGAVEFRMLDNDPKVACEKILQKLSILEKDSFTERAKGIAAWRQSGVYKLYVQMGKESIFQKVPIQNIIDTLQRGKNPFLTLDEFNAIMDLNEKIRF